MPEPRRTVRMRRAAWLILLAAGSIQAFGQQASLSVSSGSASAGGTASVNLSLNNVSGAAPTALEFTLGYPAASVTGVTLSTGASANTAGKILDCTSVTAGQTSCVLYGDNSIVLGNGVLATIGVSLAAKPASSVPLTLTGVSVSDANGEAVTNTDSGGTITVSTPAPTLSSLSCSPSSLTAAGSVLCTVALSSAATSAVTVSLASNEAVVAVPASVGISPPASSAQFTASVQAFTTAQSVVLTATANGVSETASLQLQPVAPPTNVTVTGNLGTMPGSVGVSVALLSSSGQLVQTVVSGTNGDFFMSGVTAGKYTVMPTKTGFVFSPPSKMIGAATTNMTGINFTNQVTTAPTLSSLSCSPSSLTAAGSVLCTVALSSAATSAVTVSLASNEAVVAVPASVGISPPASSAQFTASVQAFTTAQSVVLTATANGVSKTATLQLQPVAPPTNVTVTGNLGTMPGSVGVSVALLSSSGQLVQTVVSGTNGDFFMSGVAAGKYTVMPTKTGFVFSPPSKMIGAASTNLTGINFTNQSSNPSLGVISVDARASADQQSPAGTVTVSPFSTHASNELLLALVSADEMSSPNTVVKSVTGGGLTWTLVARANTQSGTSEIWRAFAPAPLTNIAVSASLSQTVASSLSVVSFTGIQTTGSGGSGAIGAIAVGHGPSGSPNANLTTTKNGSLVIGVGNDFDNAIPRSPVAGQQLLHQDLTSTQDTYWVQMLNGPVPLAGTLITVGDSAPTSDQFNLAICEILPAGGN